MTEREVFADWCLQQLQLIEPGLDARTVSHWWADQRPNGSWRLSDAGFVGLTTTLVQPHWEFELPYHHGFMTAGTLLKLSRSIAGPYYLKQRKICILHKETATMVLLYGGFDAWLKSQHLT
jgi:hypothetical protein